jgi:hypothetical protein
MTFLIVCLRKVNTFRIATSKECSAWLGKARWGSSMEAGWMGRVSNPIELNG